MKCTTIWTYKRHLVDSHRKVAHPSIFGWKWRSSKGLNSSLPRAAYMCHWNGSALAQIMACCLFCVKPLPEPTLAYCQLDPQEQTSVKFSSKYKLSIHENASEKIVCEMAAILSRERWVNCATNYGTELLYKPWLSYEALTPTLLHTRAFLVGNQGWF